MDAQRDATLFAMGTYGLPDFANASLDGASSNDNGGVVPDHRGTAINGTAAVHGIGLDAATELGTFSQTVDDQLHLHAMNVGELNAFFGNGKNDGSGGGSGLRGLQQQLQQQHQQQHHGHTGQAPNAGPGAPRDGGNGDGHPSLMRSVSADSMNLEALQQLVALSMQSPMSAGAPFGMRTDNGAPGPSGMSGATTPGGTTSTNTAALLESQLRLSQLQQLQQLQQQIFQQQIELINGQSNLASQLDSVPFSSTAGPRDTNQNPFHGLPTPANSTEIRAQPPPGYVPPMFLQNYPQGGPFNTPHPIPQAPNSAPAHLAFPTHTPLASPSDLDFELSPLTSPWLGASTYGQPSEQQETSSGPHRRGSKRGASSSGEDMTASGSGLHSRKRQSPAIRATASASTAGVRRAGAHGRGVASMNSTPALRARPRRASIIGEIPGDTPSPVDLSMPPPAPPGTDGDEMKQSEPSSSGTTPALAPVTPASIMNLGHLGLSSGLSPPLNAQLEPAAQGPKAKSQSPPKLSVPGGATKPNTKKATSSGAHISPSLKPLLPGGLPPASAAHLATASNYSHHLSGSASALNITPGAALPPPTPAVRKTSHKAAEQKRRDSLKTSFDSLRLLLPPLPLPSDENYSGEPPLPGSMPPRGPPRGDVAGPNRAVSKLQLLRCGNDFIRRLKDRISRRDEYVDQLKAEIRALRTAIREQTGNDNLEELIAGLSCIDLDRDIDAEEANAPRLGGAIMENDDEEDGE